MGRFVTTALMGCLGAALVSIAPKAQGKDDNWYFDVEVLIIKRTPTALKERFVAPPRLDVRGYTDLLSPYLRPDISGLLGGFPRCEQAPDPEALKFTPFVMLDGLRKAQAMAVPIDTSSDALRPALMDPNRAIKSAPEQQPDGALMPSALADKASPVAIEAASTQAPAPTTPFAQVRGALARPFDDPFDDGFDDVLGAIAPVTLPKSGCLHVLKADGINRLFDLPMVDVLMPKAVPEVIDGPLAEGKAVERFPLLLPATAHSLSELANQLHRQRDIAPLLHLAWRQRVVFGREKAGFMRLFAGQDLRKQLSPLAPGDSLEPNEPPSLMQQARAIILADEPLDTSTVIADILQAEATETEQSAQDTLAPLWELDGGFKVYLQYMGRVPYLHIDSELQYRLLETPLDAAPVVKKIGFSQLRRIISKQLHYFDHPYFSMLVRLERYKPPVEIEGLQQDKQ